MKRVSITTLGCKVNQFETAGLEKAFQDRGFKLVSLTEEADICIVNTCTVTSRTDRQCRQIIRQLRRRNPKALTVMTGCYAEVARDEIEKIGGIDLIIGNRAKPKIPQLVDSFLPQSDEAPPLMNGKDIDTWTGWPELVPAPMDHTRALLKVQDGCDVYCSFCIVPYARGRSRSLPLDGVLARMKGLAEGGYKEVVLTGVNLGQYGLDLHPPIDLHDLLEVLEDKKTPVRIRLSSIEPMELNRDILSLIARSKKVCHHLHIPLQSGDDEILEKMGRPYSSAGFAETIWTAIHEIPDVTIGMDVIVGFPGEEDRHFENTYHFLEGLPFTYLHIFPFSARKGTPASQLRNALPSTTLKKRSSRLRFLSQKTRERVYQGYIGKILEVLVEGASSGGHFQGLTENYLRVFFNGKKEMINQIIPVTLNTLDNGRLQGVPQT